MKGAMHCVRRYFLEQPVKQEDHLLTMIAQSGIAKHNERAGKSLIEHTYRSESLGSSCLDWLRYTSCAGDFRRALDFGFTFTRSELGRME